MTNDGDHEPGCSVSPVDNRHLLGFGQTEEQITSDHWTGPHALSILSERYSEKVLGVTVK